MIKQPNLTPTNEVPPEVRKLCERVDKIAEGMPVLVFVPNAAHSRLYPVVVIPEKSKKQAQLVGEFLEGKKLTPPPDALRNQMDLILEAIHSAADYLPTIAFLPDGQHLHPVNLVPETVPEHLQPCYLAVQRAQKTAIGTQPIQVGSPEPVE